MQAEIGLIGLGVMGANLALNIAEKGHAIAVYNRTWATTEKFIADAGPLATRIVACRTMADLAAAIRPPRPVIIMVKAGDAVDEQIGALCRCSTRDDIIIDAGNANYHDTVRRDAATCRLPAWPSSAWASPAARRARGTARRSWWAGSRPPIGASKRC